MTKFPGIYPSKHAHICIIVAFLKTGSPSLQHSQCILASQRLHRRYYYFFKAPKQNLAVCSLEIHEFLFLFYNMAKEMLNKTQDNGFLVPRRKPR